MDLTAERLKASACDVVVYVGVLTNNSVEATVRMSGNLGFASFVVSDGCWSVDKVDLRGRRWPAEDVHALSLANLHGEYATVLTAAEVLAGLP
ncbi:MAG: isochorismatase family protein [Actinomycetota bacterium]|nr:isochorismatase family protein [Actinomycetota bacterium]